MSNLDRMKTAYKAWHDSKGSNSDAWLGLFAENVQIHSIGSETRPLAFAQERRSKAEAVAYFSGLAQNWSMVHWSPHTFVTEGDKVAVFATCAWTSKATGKSVETPVAHLWTFEGGKATSLIEIFDSARVLAAGTA